MTEKPRLADWFANDYLAAAAVHLLRLRERSYPRAINEGRMTPAEAAQGLEAMRAVVAQWRWATQPTPPDLANPDPAAGWFGLTDRALVVELTTAAARARKTADRDPDSWEKRELADLVDALLWFQQPVTDRPASMSRMMWLVFLNDPRARAPLAKAA